MTTSTETVGSSVGVVLGEPLGRATAEPVEAEFRGLLRGGAGALLSGVESATRVLPGGAVVSAAVGALSGAGSAGGGGGSASLGGSGATGSMDDVLSRSALQQMELLELQARMQDENARFTALSNVLKAEHETAKTAIGNIR